MATAKIRMPGMRDVPGGPVRPGHLAISDQAWAVVLLNLQLLFPGRFLYTRVLPYTGVRMVKDEEELGLLHEAGRRADRAFGNVVQLLCWPYRVEIAERTR